MIPILHPHDAQTFNSFGIGPLSDAVSCVVDEERNGLYELTLKYPVTGVHYENITNRAIIVAKPNYTDGPQPFRVYKITRPINGVVTVYARHLTYDLSGYVDSPFTAVGIQAALVSMVSDTYCYPAGCPFTFYSDISLSVPMTVKTPASVRSLMGGVAGSLIDLYGGEWSYDTWECRLNAHRGADRGFTVRYAKNLTELTEDESVETLYTAVYPFYRSPTTDELVTLPERVLTVIETDEFSNVLTLDLSEKFETMPTVAALRQAAQAYIDSNDLGIPKVNIKLNFVQNGFSERVDLCDTIHVYYDALGIYAIEKCIRTKWDVLAGRYTEIEVGYARNSLAKTIATVQESADRAVENAARAAGGIAAASAQKITGNLGGYVVMHDSDGDGNPDEILIMDTADITTAVNVIRMNSAGIAFSSDGYRGTYTSAWTIGGEFVADFITAGTLRASMVKILGDVNFYWDAGNIYIQDPENGNNQIRIGLYDGEAYGIGFTRNGGLTWQTAMDFNGLHIEATGYSKVYVSLERPSGSSFGIGDMWVEAETDYVWNMVSDYTWNDVADNVWNDFANETPPNLYTWNGVAWQPVYEGSDITTLRAALDVAEGRIDAQTTAITTIDERVTENTTSIGIVGGNLTAEVTRAENAETQLSARIQETADGITTEVQKGLNGQGGYTSVYQTSDQVQTIVGQNAYTKNTTVGISAAGVVIGTTGHVQIGAAGSGVTIDKDGVKIDTGGHLSVDAENLEISEDGSLSARNAYLSGDIYSNNNPVMTRGGDIVVSTSQPAGHAGMIWFQPDPASSTSAEYTFPIPTSWDNRLDLYRNNRTGTLTGTGASTSFTNCTYKITVPIYIREHSGQPAGGTLRCVVSDGTRSITFTATVNEAATGVGDKAVEMTATSSVWIGAANSLSFTLSCDPISGYYVYNVLNSRDTSGSISLQCTASGAASGWVPANVKVYI